MKHTSRPVELLAPAKDLLCGMEAINHGADAVYIGAPRFGARAAAGNSVEDIRQLCAYAHLFGARIYVAFNTILKDEELKEAERLIHVLYGIGVDALIVQDMGILELDLPPIPLHASTQTDNRAVEKVQFLEAAGFSQVVLARELTLKEIQTIASSVKVPLEVFIHGALCVSYSGQCYLSAALGGRSANRGECAQYCRLPYRMTDANGQEIVSQKHLLSLKDMNRTDQLEALLDAGVTSFKIEGRLKDLSYVKNVTAWYRQQLDTILERRPEFHRSSAGISHFHFTPRPEKSFNRGFTSYLLSDKQEEITSFDTPKSKGEPVGKVKEIRKGYFTIAGLHKELNNGDGLVYFNDKGELAGFRVNRAEENRVYPLDMPSLRPKTQLYRNYDIVFEKELAKPSADRKIPVRILFRDTPSGFSLQLEDTAGHRVIIHELFEKEEARKPQQENIIAQLSKLGNTIFEADRIETDLSANWFVPSSLLSSIKRQSVERLLSVIRIGHRRELRKKVTDTDLPVYPERTLTYLGNVANHNAQQFYARHGVQQIDPAFELKPLREVPLMFTRHCLKYSMGWCPSRQQGKSPYKEPFYLHYKDTRLRLQFDCKRCMMLVYQ